MGRLPRLRDRWAGYGAEDREKARAAIAGLGLTALAKRNVLTLSGGEGQKTVIARALAQEGRVFLLDEATSELDLNHGVEIMTLMGEKARRDGAAVIAALHDLNLASHYCDRLVFLKDGVIEADGPPAQILTRDLLEKIYGFRARVNHGDDGTPFVLPVNSSHP